MDDVIAVMDAAGSERAAVAGTLEGGPMAALFAATHPDRVSALVLYATFARAHLGARLRLDLERRGARAAAWPSWSSTGARASLPAAWRPSRMGDPGFMEWAGAPRAAGGEPGHDQADLRPDRRVRRARRAALDPRADAGAAPAATTAFIKVEHSRYIAEQHPGRAAGGARGQRQPVLDRRHRGADRRDRGVPHRRAPRARARPHARDRAVHRHLRLDRARGARWATAAGASCSSATTRSSGARSTATAAARSSAPATASWPPSTGRRARSAAPPTVADAVRLARPRGARRAAHRRAGGHGRRPGRPGGPHRRARDGHAPSPARCWSRAP